MKQLKYLLTGIALLLLSITANAQLAGKNVLLIHGFQAQHLLLHPADDGLADSLVYWQDFEPTLMDPASSRILYWPSQERISGPDGSAAVIASQLKPILESGFCDDQCVLLTHSTGDLVARYVLANKLSLLGSTLANRFKVAAVIDMAGAGGGTELASLAVDMAYGAMIGLLGLEALEDVIGIELDPGTYLGVINDLQPSVARNTAVNSIPAIPRLRIAATGDEIYGPVAHLFIKGGDDSQVPLHSACGAADSVAYDSCVQDLQMDGRITRVWNAPSQSQLYDYHYPIILSATTPHDSMRGNMTGHDMTFALSGADNYSSGDAKTIDVAVEYETSNGWWDWFHEYRFITGAKEKTMGRVIVDSFE
ncbi:MAG: hypothetical protein PVI92_12720 [Chromatiales bacterium]|jgi:hypothetical protein